MRVSNRVKVAGLLAMVLCGVAACGGNLSAADHIARAETFTAEGRFPDAVIALRNAIREAPGDATARLLLAEALLAHGDPERALREFERAADLGANDARVELGIQRSKLGLGRHAEIIGDLAGLEELTPALANVLGEALLSEGDLARAEAVFAAVGASAEGLSGLGAIAAARGDLETARRQLTQATALGSDDADVWLRAGNVELASGRFAEAERAFEHAATLPGGALQGNFGRARTFLAQGRTADADAALGKVLEGAPEFVMGHYLRAATRVESGDMEGAEREARRALELAPGFAQAEFLLGTILYRAERRVEAEEVLERFLRREPRNADGLKVLASLMVERSDYAAAEQLLEDIALDTTDAQLLSIYGTTQMQLGKPDRAIAAFSRAVELAPDVGQFRTQLALGLIATGDSDAAERLLADSAGVADGADGADGSAFENDRMLVFLHLQQRDWAAAETVIARLAAATPDSPVPDQLRGTLRQLQGGADAGDEDFNHALAKDPTYLPAVQALALMAEQRGDAAAARSLYEGYAARVPDSVPALTTLGDIAAREGDATAAADYYRRALAAQPGAAQAALGLARLHTAQGRVDEARATLVPALERAPNHPDLLLVNAELALAAGRPALARESLGRLAGLADRQAGNPMLNYAVGILEMRLGNRAGARTYLERAVAGGGTATAPRVALGMLALQDNDVAGARARLAELAEAGAAGSEVELLRADILSAEGQRDDARAIHEALMAAGVREGFLRRASQQLAGRDAAGAIGTLEAGLGRHPGDTAMRLMLAEVLMASDPRRAIEQYERLESGGHPIALNNLAWLYMEQGDARAVAVARKALAAAPDNPDVLDTVGWVLHQAGHHEEALPLLRRGVELAPGNPDTHYHLAVALNQAGDRPGARRHAREALAAGEFANRAAAEALLK